MKLRDWRDAVNHLSERVIKKSTSPLLFKEVAWKVVGFAAKCGESNPISFLARPMVTHKLWRLTVGVYLGLAVIGVSMFGPGHLAARQENSEAPIEVLPVPPVTIATIQRVRFPLPVKNISQSYWLLHKGVDLVVPEGTPVNPIMGGEVVETEYGKHGYGFKVVVDHKNGYRSLYAHLSEIDVAVGEEITTDESIGKSGDTGRSTGPHLHLELREGEKDVNPLSLFKD